MRSSPPADSGASLWVWVLAGFVALAIAWSSLFTFARRAQIESVPLAPASVKGEGR
jgi:hypothetical protein